MDENKRTDAGKRVPAGRRSSETEYRRSGADRRRAPASEAQQRRRQPAADTQRAPRRKPKKSIAEKLRRETQQEAERQPVRVRNTNFWLRIITVAAIVLAVFLGIAVFFRVSTLEVRYLDYEPFTDGTEESGGEDTADGAEMPVTPYYSPEEIISASGIEKGDNLLTISGNSAAASIIAKCPYVSEVRIERKLPNTVVITVREYETAYAVRDTAGSWYLINRKGVVLEQTDRESAQEHLVIEGMYILPASPGENIELTQLKQTGILLPGAETEPDDGTELSAQLRSLLQVLPVLEEYGFSKEIVTLDMSSSYKITFRYGTQYEVNIGNTENLDYKMAFFSTMLKKLESYNSGTIDLSEVYENKEARLLPFK